MACRTRRSYFFVFLATALILAGCAPNQQSRFQTAFLPAMPPAAALPPALPEPPALQPHLFLRDTPAVLNLAAPPPAFSERSDALIERAGQRFERARKHYHAQELDRARREFDAAIDLMLEASD